MGGLCSSASHSSEYKSTKLIRIAPKSEHDDNMAPMQISPMHMKFNSLMKLPSGRILTTKRVYSAKKPLCRKVEMEACTEEPNSRPLVSLCGSYSAYRKQLLKHIRSARSSIVVCLQALQDPKIWKALKEQSQTVNVEILFLWSNLDELKNAACEGIWEELKINEGQSATDDCSQRRYTKPAWNDCPTKLTEIIVSNSATSLSWMQTIIEPPSPLSGIPTSATFCSLDSEGNSSGGSLMLKRIFWETEARCISCNFIIVDSATVLVSSCDLDADDWKVPMCGVINQDDTVAQLYRNLYDKIDSFSLNYKGFAEYMKKEGFTELQYNSPSMQIRFGPLSEERLWFTEQSLFAYGMHLLKERVVHAPGTYALYVNAKDMQSSVWTGELVALLSNLTRTGAENGNTFQCKAKFRHNTSFPRFTSVKSGIPTNCHNYTFLYRAQGESSSLFSTVSLDGFSLSTVCSNQIMFHETYKPPTNAKSTSSKAIQMLLPGSAVAVKNQDDKQWPIHRAFMMLYEGS